jgi:hypothetical protein
MALYRIVSWKDIPAMVEARDGLGTVSQPLSERFQMLIDSVAVQLGLDGSEQYMELWTRGEEHERPGTAQEVARAVAGELENRFLDVIARAFRRP